MAWYSVFGGKKETRKAIPLIKRSFKGASGGRLFADFFSSSASADQELKQALVTLRNRSRELSRNDAYVSRYLNLLTSNVVGASGIRVNSKARDADGTLDQVANTIIESAWKKFSKKGNCTVDGQQSMIDCQKMFIEALARDGEVLVRQITDPASEFGYRLEFLEADHLIDTKNETFTNGNRIVMGVEIDARRKPVAYHLYKNHPSDLGTGQSNETIRVPAEEVIHAFIRQRPEQTRGYPFVASVMSNIKMLNGYYEAEIVAARVSSAKMGFFTTPAGDGYVGDDLQDDYTPISNAEAGVFEQLPAGMDFKPFDPAHPTTAFDSFSTAVLRSIASGLNISYHSLSNDLSSVNYSSLRAGSLEDRDQYRMLQKFMVEHFVEPVFRSWLKNAMTKSMNLPIQKYDKFADGVSFIPRSWGWVDPQREMAAHIAGLQNGIVTYQDIEASYGRDVEELFEQHDREQKLAEQYNIKTAFQPFGAKLPTAAEVQGVIPDDGSD
jgi:lambda family phage portal protein